MAIYRKIDQERAWRSIKKRAFERFKSGIDVFFNSALENITEVKIEASIYISVEAWQVAGGELERSMGGQGRSSSYEYDVIISYYHIVI